MSFIHTIYSQDAIDLRAGGPMAYLANLRYGLDRLPDDPDLEIWIHRKQNVAKPPHPALSPEEQHRIKHNDLLAYIRRYENESQFTLTEGAFQRLMTPCPAMIHLHLGTLAFQVMNAFRQRGVQGIPVLLTSHSPESAAKEIADIFRSYDFDPALTDRLERAARRIEAQAFQNANVWVFPSEEAMEPYAATIPDFRAWARDKDIRFIPTGALPAQTSMTRDAFRARYGLSDKKVVAFIGRHNAVKGYDIFCQACLEILNARDDVIVLAAGSPNAAFQSPQHPRWIELGWYGAAGDILQAADLFVLPNRMTYFDLVLIEAMAAGADIVASATGGNKTVSTMTNGAIHLYDGTAQGLKKQIENRLDIASEERTRLKEELRTLYEKHFTPTAFATRYRDLIKNLHREYF